LRAVSIIEGMALNVARCRTDLDELERELQQMSGPGEQGLELWRHKLTTLIEEILQPYSAVSIRFANLSWDAGARSPRRQLESGGPVSMWSGPDVAAFQQAKQTAGEIIQSLRWELDRLPSVTHPLSEATIDPELWDHVRVVVEAGDWDKVGREAAVFVESKLRDWADLPSSVKGSADVFKAALGTGKFVLGGQQPSENQGWQQLGTGFAMALRNRSGHRVETRGDAKRYALGVLGTASLLLTELRHDYGDPPHVP
jgi:hypothetical protein